jgi:exosortase
MSNGTTSIDARGTSLPIDWVKAAWCVALGGMAAYAYWWQPAEHEMSCYTWLVWHWLDFSHYSHGPLIPLIASFLLWWNVSHQEGAPKDWSAYWRAVAGGGAALGIWFAGSAINSSWERPAYLWAMRLLPWALAWQVWTLRRQLAGRAPPATIWGVSLVSAAMLVYYVGVKAVQPRVTVFSGILLLYGLVLSFRGWDVFRLVFFPISFLLLMIPLNFLDNAVGFPLRMFVATWSTALLNWLGIEAVQRGSGIVSRVFQFDVADPCSGIRSLMALMTITAAYAYVTLRVQWKRWLLFASAMPLAVLGNLARVLSIALVAQVYGQELATKVYHDWSGFILFPVALAAMVGFGYVLDFPYRRLLAKWLEPPQPQKPDA